MLYAHMIGDFQNHFHEFEFNGNAPAHLELQGQEGKKQGRENPNSGKRHWRLQNQNLHFFLIQKYNSKSPRKYQSKFVEL